MRINEVIQLQIKSTGHRTARQLKEVLWMARAAGDFCIGAGESYHVVSATTFM